MALKIGQFVLDSPFVQAALSGYSDLAMRRIARRHGASYAVNEVVLDMLVIQKGKKQKFILDIPADDHPVGGQLMGSQPEQFAPAAAAMAEAGYDVIDINFGCPVKKVLGRCRGGFLLSDPKTALEIVQGVYDAVGKTHPVTVKMRRGMDDSPESERRFFEILDGALEIGISAVTVHGRTVKQKYIGPSQWEFLTKVKQYAGDVTVLGSGDLFHPEACLNMIRETGVDGVTIARGCIGNPWIFRECLALWRGEVLPEPPSIAEQRDTIRDHFIELEMLHGPHLAGRMMRKFGIKYAEHHPHSLDVRNAFVQVKQLAELEEVLERWYADGVDWPPVQRRATHGVSISSCHEEAAC